MNILISGAGIAGLSLAYWLNRYGFKVTIVEKAPALLMGGYKIDIRGVALTVIKQMGIYDSIVNASTDMQTALLVDKSGKIIQKMSGDEFGHRSGEDMEIIRGRLCQILKDQLLNIEIIFDESIQEISTHSNGVSVKFKNQSPREFDLIIGADGLHSTVRRLTFGDETHFLHHLGLYLCVFDIPNYLNLDRTEMEYTEIGKIAAVWSASGESTMKACFGFAAPVNSIAIRDRTQQQQVIQTLYQGIDWEVPRFLELMPHATDYYFDSASQVHMQTWSKERVVLLGDAGYCPSPMSGQGTSLALVGAYVLAGELMLAKGNYKSAFDEYEKQMRPFVKANQELGMRAAKLMSRNNKNLSTWLLNKMMQYMPGYCTKFFISRATNRIKKAANNIYLKSY